MKTDDIFEALTDIDDELIAAARPTDPFSDPVIVRPAAKSQVRKTIISIAACVAVICAAGTFGAKYINDHPNVESSYDPTTLDESLQNMSGSYSQCDLSNGNLYLEKIFVPQAVGAESSFTVEEFPNTSFKATYNEITAGSSPIFSADQVKDLYLYDLNDDGRRELCATVYQNGVTHVEVFDLADGERYTSIGWAHERSHIQAVSHYLRADGYNLELVADMGSEYNYSDVVTGINTIISTQLSLDELTWVISANIIESDYTGRFIMKEFPDLHFIKTDDVILMGENGSDSMKRPVISGNFVLADLNGDGKREICAEKPREKGDPTYITVYDISNDETYFEVYDNTEDEMYSFDFDYGELKLVKNQLRSGREIINEEKITLTLDDLRKQAKPEYEKVPLAISQTFTLPDFEGVTFNVDADTESFDFSWEKGTAGEGGVDNVYLCDLDGDGTREIIIVGPYLGVGGIKVCGYMDDGEIGSVYYLENDGCRLAESGGKLVYVSGNGEEKPFEFTKADLKPTFPHGYHCEVVSYDYTIDFSEVFPWCLYNISITDRRLKIDGGDMGYYDPDIEMKDLYTIVDKDNDQLLIAFTDANNGGVVLVKLTENNIDHISMKSGVALKPTDERLSLVNADSGEELFVLPGQYDLLAQ